MRSPRYHRSGSLMALALVALALAGCSAQDGQPTPSPTATIAAPASTTPAPQIDWSAPEKASLPGGWALSNCSGDAPLLCVARGGKPVGQLESIAYDPATLPEFAEVLGKQGESAALADHAQRFVKDFTADRAQGCGAGYTVTGEPLRQLATADGAAVRYGFTGTLADGRPSERVAHYAGVRGNQLVLLVANASDPGGCLDDAESTVFTSAELREFLPLLDQLITASGLPRP